MIKRGLLIITALLSLSAIGQKELTLEDAVMNQYRAYYPENVFGFSFLPEGDCYTYLKGYTTLMKGQPGKEEKEWMTIADVNEILGTELRYFSGMEWKDAKNFWLNDGTNYYWINPTEKKGGTVNIVEEDAENVTFDNSTEAIAYTKENNLYIHTKDDRLLEVTSNEDKNIVSGQAIARSEFGITNGIFWSTKGNFLAFYQKDETNVTSYPLVDYDAYPAALNSIKYPMAGQKSEKPRVGIYNLKTKTSVYITPKGDSENYLTNVSWTPDEKHVLIAEVNRGQNHVWLNLYDAQTGVFVRTILEEKEDTWAEPEHPAYFPNETSNFVWISERDGYNNLYYYDLNGKLIKKLTENKFPVLDIEKTDSKGNIFFTATGTSPLNTMLYKVNLKGKQSLITQTEGTHSTQITSDGAYVFDQYSNHDTPNKAVLLNSKGKVEQTFVTASNPYDGITMGTAEISTIKSADGKTDLYQRLIKPSNFDPNKKYPVLVYVYGGPHAQLITNSWGDGASLWMYWMAEQGYLVYTVDNRGSANRGFEFENVIHRNLGDAEMADQLKGVDYLKSLPYVDGERLAVHGWSFGGFMTTSLMLRHAGVFNVGVAGGPVTDWKYYEIMYGERYMDRPEENKEGYEKASLMTHADKLKGDLLLIHGTSDNVVVMQHNLALVKKFVELGLQMDFFPYPMHEHNVRGKDRVHLMQKVLEYVLENN